jgi:hypothetical protein
MDKNNSILENIHNAEQVAHDEAPNMNKISPGNPLTTPTEITIEHSTFDINNNLIPNPSNKAPILIPIGPTSVGKTAVLQTLFEYTSNVRNDNYKVPSKHHFEWVVLSQQSKDLTKGGNASSSTAKNFFDNLKKRNFVGSTNKVTMLAAKCKNKPIFNLLESQGEHYYNHNSDIFLDTAYLNKIKLLSNRKIYMLIFSLEMFGDLNITSGVEKKDAYVAQVIKFINAHLKNNKTGDKILIILTKIDTAGGSITGETDKQIIARAFGAGGPFAAIGNACNGLKAYNSKYSLLPLVGGSFKEETNEQNQKSETRDMPDRKYPISLVKEILALVKGRYLGLFGI